MPRFTAVLLIAMSVLAAAGCSRGTKDVSDYVARAEQLQASGNVEKAQVELHQALAINPRDPKANLALARIEDEAGNLQAAVPRYALAASPEAHLIEPQLRIVQVLIDSGRYAEAAGRINTTLGAFPNSAEALALRADLSERQGQLGSATTDANAALQKDRDNARATAVLASLALRGKNSDEAAALVDRGLQKHPNDMRLLQVRAAIFLTTNQPDRAVDALKAIVRTSPRNVAIQTAIAQLEANNGRPDEAIANFKAAVAANPSDTDMQLAFIRFLGEQNKGGDVVDYLRKMIAANPATNIYDIVLAEYFRTTNQIEQASKVLDDAANRLKQGPDYLTIRTSQAKSQALLGHPEAAAKITNEVLAADPQNERALLFKATLDAENSRMADAVANLLKVVRLNPTNAQAFQLLASSYLELGQPKMAVDAMQRAVAVVPGDTGAQIKLAAFLQRAGQIDPSRDLIQRLLLQAPGDKRVWVANGELAIDRKDWATVDRSITRLRELPGSESPALALTAASQASRGDASGAAKSYQDLIGAGGPIDPGVFGSYARASAASGKAQTAADFLQQHVSALKDDALQQAWMAIMTLRADAGQYDQADAAFQKAVALTPRDVKLYGSYMRILVSQRKVAQARQVIAKGLAAGTSKTPLLLMAGGIDEITGDIPGAMKLYQQALANNPLSVQAANNYGSLLADQDPKNLAALQQVRDAMAGAEGSTDPLMIDTIAWLDYRLGRFDEAKRLMDQIRAGQSDNPQLRFHLAAIMLALGDKSGGQALLETVKGMSFPGADEARSLSAT